MTIKKANNFIEDSNRQPPTDNVKQDHMAIAGVAGVKISTGFVHDEFIVKLVGERGRRIYREMRDNDATVGAILFAVEMLLRAAKWRVEPKEDAEIEDADTSNEEKVVDISAGIKDHDSAVAFVEGVLFNDMSHTWDDFVANILTMLPYGWQWTEVCYKRRNGITNDQKTTSLFDDGLIGIYKLADRSQETLDRWDMDESGCVFGMWQEGPNGGNLRYIPMEKSLHFRPHPFKDSPEGRSVLRAAYRSWYFLKNIQEIEAIAIERELNGLPVVYIPSAILNGTSTEAKAAVETYKKMVRDVKFNEQGGIVLPSDPFYNSEGDPGTVRQVEFALVNANGTRAVDTDKVIKRYQGDIARTILAQFILMSQSGSKGGYAQSENETDIFLRAAEGWLESIAATINRQLIPKLWQLNGLDQEYMPHVVPGQLKPENLGILGDFIQKLSGAGLMFTDIDTENHLRELAGLPAVSEETRDEINFDDEPINPDLTKPINAKLNTGLIEEEE